MTIVDRIIAHAKRTPYQHLAGYMERYWLYKSGACQPNHTSLGIRIHRILRSDQDRHMHDHPWSSISIVLRGGYWEVVPLSQTQDPVFDPYAFRRVWRGPGAIVFRRANTRHRIEIPEGRDAWSMFIMGRYAKAWGFYTEGGFVYWRTYLGLSEKEA